MSAVPDTRAEHAQEPATRVLRAVSVVSLMTAVSRVLGLVREIAMAYFFGTSALKSAFDLAFVIPNLFRRLFGEGALSSAFVPVFSESLVKEGRDSALRFAVRVISLLVAVLGAVTVLGILLTWPLAGLLPSDSRWLIPLPMLRIMLPYALLICVAALLSGLAMPDGGEIRLYGEALGRAAQERVRNLPQPAPLASQAMDAGARGSDRAAPGSRLEDIFLQLTEPESPSEPPRD